MPARPLARSFPRYYEAKLAFTAPDVDQIAKLAKIAFLALPHGLAAEYALPLVARGVRVIDVSADFRLDDAAVYKQYYKTEHPAPEWLPKAVYGLAERYREQIRQAPLIAVAGCYPTSILLRRRRCSPPVCVRPDGIVISSMSGVSGAGRKEDVTLLFAECNESARPYSVTGHRHLSEIEQELAKAAGLAALPVNFLPHLIPVTRGIHTTIVFNLARDGVTAADVQQALNAVYADEQFVRILKPGDLADTKHVTHTNVCEIGYAVDARTGRLIVSSAIDNLTKGGLGAGRSVPQYRARMRRGGRPGVSRRPADDSLQEEGGAHGDSQGRDRLFGDRLSGGGDRRRVEAEQGGRPGAAGQRPASAVRRGLHRESLRGGLGSLVPGDRGQGGNGAGDRGQQRQRQRLHRGGRAAPTLPAWPNR